MVLGPYRGRLQSHSHPETARRNGMSPSGASNMRQNRNQQRSCSADREPSIRLFDPQTSRKSLSEPVFQQPAKRKAKLFILWIIRIHPCLIGSGPELIRMLKAFRSSIRAPRRPVAGRHRKGTPHDPVRPILGRHCFGHIGNGAARAFRSSAGRRDHGRTPVDDRHLRIQRPHSGDQ